MTEPPITPEFLLNAYVQGYFPMAKSRRGRILYWFNPDTRMTLKLEDFHQPRSLQRFLKHADYRVTFDNCFEKVIRACADHRAPNRDGTWINAEIIRLYTTLHEMGFAHSVEVWEDNSLIGGLYGVSIGGVFCGESMFSAKTNASKVGLSHLVAHLKTCGYQLIDAQFENPHLTQFGFKPMEKETYLEILQSCLSNSASVVTRFSMTSPSNASTSGE